MPNQEASGLPPEIVEILTKTEIGYLSVTSPKGDLYSYPVAFHFSGQHVNFFTPASSAKLRFIKANPLVSMIIDNRKLTQDACGAMIQGTAKVFSIRKMLMSVVSTLSTTRHFSKKYPGLFSFYTKGRDLPDDRRFYKYRLIQISPKKILYWVGYKFGRYFPKAIDSGLERHFASLKSNKENGESNLEMMAEMLESYDETSASDESVSPDIPWIQRLDQAASKGSISNDERRMIQLFTKASKSAEAQHKSSISDEENLILKKWRASSTRA